MTRPLTLLTLLIFNAQFLLAQGPVRLNKTEFFVCDTIDFDWYGDLIGKGYRYATLHLWIDDIDRGRRWKFRYPIINGRAEGQLVIASNREPGRYALNFMGADQRLEVQGVASKVKVKTAKNYETRKIDTVYMRAEPGMLGQDVKYMLLSRKGMLFDSTLQVNADGSFRLPPILFGDTASLVFKPEKSRSSYMIDLETPLDSAFTPFHTTTVFIDVKGPGQDSVAARPDSSSYSFVLDDPYKDVVMMEEVVVTGKSKEQKFDDTYVSGMFKNNLDGRTFSGIDNDQISRYNNMFTFLQSAVPGLVLRSTGISINVTWRNDPVSFFLDEIRVDVNALLSVPATEIALIKTYPPPASISSFVFGGAVAVYTKKGEYATKQGPRYSFPINGYTQGLSNWGYNQ